ncbi:MAG: glutamine--fructose-6-phosphate transaminase (isomerizing) [bacterium]
MCGIVGYIGKDSAPPILLDGLKRLEYRGYDSAGIAVPKTEGIELRRVEGKLTQLDRLLAEQPLEGDIGIGHTRWATHGRPSEANAHPHLDCRHKIAVVHNGIIENYMELKEELMAKGHKFKSETDTEVLAHLIEEYMDGNDLETAVRLALKRVDGSYAIGVIRADEPSKIVGARLRSPLVVGFSNNEFYIASDIPAILNRTRRVAFMDDHQMVVLKRDGVSFTTLDGDPVEKATMIIEWDALMAEKGGYKHFMLKEIYEQPRVIEETLHRARLKEDSVDLPDVRLSDEELLGFDRIFIVACGTSWHAGLVGKFLLEKYARISVEVDIGSEFRYRDPIIKPTHLVMAISQSGETADTIAAITESKEKGAKVVSICNVLGSTISRESDGVIYTQAGPEIGVASTKAFTAQLTALALFTLYLGSKRGTISSEQMREIIADLHRLPKQAKEILTDDEEIRKCASEYYQRQNFLYLGRGINYPIALEGALKLKEISYIHAEGYPAGEMKHGPIALIDEKMPVVVVATSSRVYDKVLGNIEEVKARNGTVLACATEGDDQIRKRANHIFFLPKTQEDLSPILNVIPFQLLAYHIAVLRGCDVDQPRNLAKSVTVE